MAKDQAPGSVVLTVNAQQLDFIERMRRTHYPELSVADMVRRALAETRIDDSGLLRDRAASDV